MSGRISMYILSEKNTNKVWGIYNSDLMLESMIRTMLDINPNLDLMIKEYSINTNICTKKIVGNDFIKKGITNDISKISESIEGLDVSEKCVRLELQKLKRKHEKFLSLQNTFTSLSQSNGSGPEIPDFLKKDYLFFQEMESKKIPSEEQFNFYMDNVHIDLAKN